MNKLISIIKLAFVLLISGTSMSATAQNVIEEGTAFYPAYGEIYTFTPNISGTLTANVGSSYYYAWSPSLRGTFLYRDPELTDPVYVTDYFEVGEYITEYYLNEIEAGEIYYFSQDRYSSGNVPFTFTMTEDSGERAITSVSPTTSVEFNYVETREIIVEATQGISSYGTVTISCINMSVTLDHDTYDFNLNGPVQKEFLQIGGGERTSFKDLIQSIAESGASEFTVTITEVRSNDVLVTENATGDNGVTVNDGTVSITYSLLTAPKYLPSESYWPSSFYRYWPTGDDSGIVKMVFDQDIASVGDVTLIMGYYEYGSETPVTYPIYNLNDNMVIDGKTVYIDFTGVERVSSESEVTVIVNNVIGVNGMPVDMSAFGSANLSLVKYLPYSDDEAPAIFLGVIASEEDKEVIYNLNGLKLSQDKAGKGVYIINGRKVILK